MRYLTILRYVLHTNRQTSEIMYVYDDFGRKIIFIDEAHFWLSGYVDKQNFRIWDDANPHEVHQVAMHPQKVTVSCGFWADGVIGPYFFENDVGGAIIVNGELQIDDNQFLLAQIGRYGRGRYVVPTGRRYVSHSERHDGHSTFYFNIDPPFLENPL